MTATRVRKGLVTIAVLALALLVHLAMPGDSVRHAPYSAVGQGGATIGDVGVEVHGVTLASTIVVDDASVSTTGVFVVVDATFAVTGVGGTVQRELVVGQTVYDPSPIGPNDAGDLVPSAGFPVWGDTVFEIDRALLGTAGAALLQLRAALGFDASGDLEAQAVAVLQTPASIEDAVPVTPLGGTP